MISVIILSFGLLNKLEAQKVRWAYKVNKSQYGAGKPGIWKAGHTKWSASFVEKKRSKVPGVLHYYFMPFSAQQLIVIENLNPGAIIKIEVEYSENDKLLRKIVYEAVAKRASKDFISRNIYFDMLPNITGVFIYMDYMKVEGENEITAVALADFKEKYKAHINTPDKSAFTGKPMDMHDDVSGKASPTALKITIDNRFIYFNHEGVSTLIYRGTIGANGKIKKVERSKFNLPMDKSIASGLVSISQDNNSIYVSSMDIGKMNLYKVYLGKNVFGKPKWKYDKVSVSGYKSNLDNIQNTIMSYDQKYLICRMAQKGGDYKGFEGELFVFIQNENGSYGNPIHMGFDINTIGGEIPCYLAPDNKTFFFASNGHIGYGQKDIYVTTRLDDSWQNWSMPINLGKPVNSKNQENYFILDSKAEYAYYITWDDGSDLFRIKLAETEKVGKKETIVKQIKPDPVIVFRGKVLDKKTKKPIYASIIYTDLETGIQMGKATSNAETGEYSIALTMGYNYGFEALAKNYITISENINAKDITESIIIDKDLFLAPLEVGQTIVLNNIFFETGKSQLKKESNIELNKLLKILISNANLKIEISGHTDNVGSSSSNLKLSKDRAKSVVDWLVTHEIDASRLVAKGYGETKPISTNETEEGRAINRRVEFTIVGN